MPVVLVPWRPSPHREAAWEWVRARYAESHPDWSLQLCEAPGGPWCKGAALAAAIAAAPAGEVLITADADVWCDGLEDAVDAVKAGASWAMPHHLVHRLTGPSTVDLLAEGGPWDRPTEQPPYPGIAGGGFVVARRETLLRVPLDPRFIGWGQEDECQAIALQVLEGEVWRGTAPLVHLWHPPQQRMTRRRGSQESWRLRRRYFTARADPAAMAALIEEIHAARTVSELPGDDHPAELVGG